MRKALNENPVVQMVVLAGVGLIMVVLLFTMVLKKDPAATTDTDAAATAPAATDSATADPATSDPATADPAAPATDTGTGTPAPGTDTGTGTPAPGTSESVTPPVGGGSPGGSDGLLASKGLPKDVLVAYAGGKAVVLLVIDPKGLADKQLKTYTDALKSRKDVTVFVVKSKDVADYSRITAGVSVNRVPALVVVRPRKLTKAEPTASVSYGFRGPRSVDQAVDDALYDGGPVTSYP